MTKSDNRSGSEAFDHMVRAGTSVAVVAPLYEAWIDALIGKPVPPETDADCTRCAMCAGPAEPVTDDRYWFDPELKCCTFFPRLPSFLVGRILNDGGGACARLEEVIAGRSQAGGIVSPLGIDPPSKYCVLYESGDRNVGKDASLGCPYRVTNSCGQGAQCGIWLNRPSTCTTWFCKYVRGRVGEQFWHEMHRLLAAIETNLRWWCILQSGFTRSGLRKLLRLNDALVGGANGSAGLPDVEKGSRDYKALWEVWTGREAAYFQLASERVSALNWSKVVELGGQDIEVRAQLVLDAFEQLASTAIPPRLKMGRYQVIAAGPAFSRVVSYRLFDPVELPNRLLDALRFFDGRTTDQIVAQIAADTSQKIQPGLILKLVDHGILEPGDN